MTSPLTKKQWEASVAEMWSASVKATCQDLIDEAVKAERERLTDAAMKAAEKAVDVAIKLEREACAKLVEDSWMAFSRTPNRRLDITPFPELEYVAKVIRARGQA